MTRRARHRRFIVQCIEFFLNVLLIAASLGGVMLLVELACSLAGYGRVL